MLHVEDRALPPDHDAFVASDPPTGRVIIIAPTRAACETIEIALGLHIETYLEKMHGEDLRNLARSGRGFGIVAGTGTGKTLAVRAIAEEILRAPLNVGVVNREREATPELPSQNAIVVTTGIARRWFQDGDILSRDTLVVDEIHQTSAELELCLALGKRVGCRFIWLSATVDPAFYSKYLRSASVLQVTSFDPQKAAEVRVVNSQPLDFLNGGFASQISREKRGVGVFLPTRAGVEQAARQVGERYPDLSTAFYHGGEPVTAIRPFLEEGGAPKPYLLAMTAAGQSALNVRGLDTVVIDDTRFSNVIQNGRNVLTRTPLGNNEILQMAGRVHGRVKNGRVFILSDRQINFSSLRPTAPDFQLAGDSERVALTCADLGVRADELDLPVPLDRVAYKRAVANLQERGIITENGRLSTYGKAIEALPVDRAWAELLVNADKDLVLYLAVASAFESLHRVTREEHDIGRLVVPGSDHLTAYNLYADAYQAAGFIGEVYGLPRHLFDADKMAAWAEERGVLSKAIEDASLAMASILRGLHIPLPDRVPLADARILRRFCDLLARLMPFDLVIDEETADGQLANVSRTSVCPSWGAVAGDLRYFAGRDGAPRAAIEGTHLSPDLVRRYAKRVAGEWEYDARRASNPLVLKRRVSYFGFKLESYAEPIREFSPELAPGARRELARALARFEAQHMDVKELRAEVEEVREAFRRSGGQTPRLGFAELVPILEAQLEEQQVLSLLDFRNARFSIRADDFVPVAERKRLRDLPAQAHVRGHHVAVTYEVEEGGGQVLGVARLRLPERLARTLSEDDLPVLDRPLRFAVERGQRGSLRAKSLEDLQEMLEGPWTPNEGGVEYVRERPRARGPKPGPKSPGAGGRGAGGGRQAGRRGGGRRGR
jgi:hypothetical protein